MFRSNFMLLRLFFWQIRIDKIRADHYSSALERSFIEGRNMARLARHRMALERAYEKLAG